MAHKAKKDDEEGIKVICRNKRAFHEYLVLDRLESASSRTESGVQVPGLVVVAAKA